jgi:L-alanine-DL-glutamate epimerase-like enolase superfamily enzyme
LKITDVKTSFLQIPLPGDGVKASYLTPWAGEATRTSPYTLVKIFTDEGITGIGGQVPGYGIELKTMIDDVVKPFLLNEVVDPFFIGKLSDMIRWWRHRIGPRACCVEVALWDILGKAAKQPLYRLFGARQDKVKVYASTIEVKTPAERAKDAARWLDDGFQSIKLKMNNPAPKKDLETVRAVRDAVGNEMEIMCDAFQAWRTKPPFWSYRTAAEMAKELEKLEVVWLEEPLGRYDLEGLSALASAVDMPIAGGEIEFGVHRFMELMVRGCYDIVQPCVTWAGGFQEVRKIAAMAEAASKRCILCCWGVGLTLPADLQLIGSITCDRVEFGYDPPAYTPEYRDSILKEPLLPRSGYIEIPKGPGLGVELNEEMVAKFRVA